VKELHDVIRSTRGLADELSLYKTENVVEKAHAVAWQTPMSLVLIVAGLFAVAIYVTFFLLAEGDGANAISEIARIAGK
jgi:type VI secretion system protein ImpK